MGKQAMGIYVTNFDRIEWIKQRIFLHVYGMRPLVDTRIMNLINLNTHS